MPALLFMIVGQSLHKKLSMSVQLRSENRVGRVIFGKKVWDVTVLKKLLTWLFSFILNISMLKSPAIITSLLDLVKIVSMRLNSSSKIIIISSRFVWWPVDVTYYKFFTWRYFTNFDNWPSHMLDCSHKVSILYFFSSFRYIARPQCALHVLLTEIKLYPSILSSDVSDSFESHDSCKHIAPILQLLSTSFNRIFKPSIFAERLWQFKLSILNHYVLL